MSLGGLEAELPWNLPTPSVGAIELGTVGWDNDSEICDLTNNDYPLVKVQLFRGKNPTKQLKDPTVGAGHKILTMIASNIGRVPPRGSRVYVVLPASMENVIGAGCIVAVVEKFKASQVDKDRAVLDYGDQHVVIKAKSITLMDPDNRFISIGSPFAGGAAGITVQDEKGAGLMVQSGHAGIWSADGGQTKSVLQLGLNGLDLLHNGTGQTWITFSAGKCTILAGQMQVASGNILLGVGPVYGPVLHGTVASPAVPVPSTTVYLGP